MTLFITIMMRKSGLSGLLRTTFLIATFERGVSILVLIIKKVIIKKCINKAKIIYCENTRVGKGEHVPKHLLSRVLL